jgi:hypothetical protein
MLTRSRPEADASPRQLVVPATVAAVGAAALAAKGLLLPVNMYDAGITASAGTFILHGLVPYRDFWMLYGPLGGYLAALAGVIFPPNVTIVQLVGLALVATQAAAGYVLLRCTRVAPIAALLVAMVSAAASSSLVGLEISSWQCSVVGAFVALAVTSRAHTPRTLLLAGVIVGISLLLRQDVGTYALVAVLVMSRSARPLVGMAIIVGPAALILLAAVPVSALYEQLVWYPIGGTRVYRALPDPLSQLSGPTAATLGVIFVWGARASVLAAASRAVVAREASPAGLIVFALLCQLQTLGRGDFYHFSQAAGPAFLCLGTIFTTVRSRWGSDALVAIVSVLAFVAAFATPVTVENAASYDAAIGHAVAYVRQETTPNEPIFVGLTSNRYTFVNPLMVYYLADRPPGVRDTMYNPGVTSRDATQREMIADLGRSGTRYLVLDRLFASVCEPTNASCELGSPRLDAYISTQFKIAADFGDVVVMVRRLQPGARPQ